MNIPINIQIIVSLCLVCVEQRLSKLSNIPSAPFQHFITNACLVGYYHEIREMRS